MGRDGVDSDLIMSTYDLKMRSITPPDPVAVVLFGKLRRELLALLYRDPAQQLYFRELARLTGASPGALHRELTGLARVELVRRSRRGRQVFYEANTGSPIFQDLRGLLEKTLGTVDVLRAALAPLADRIEGALLFGSVASGRSTPQSDVDLLVIGDVEFSEVSDALADAELRLGREITPVVYSLVDFQRRVAEGKHFLTSVLGAPYVVVMGELPDGARGVARQRVAQGAQAKPGGDHQSSRRGRPGAG